MKVKFSQALLLTVLTLFFCHRANAGVVINGTRIIYPAQSREVTVQLENVGETPSLVQAWIDSGDKDQTPDNSDAPFILTPPISRVEPGRSQALRVIFSGKDLPADRESVFWLNVLDVPPSPTGGDASEQNYLQVAFRSRIKLFYRPDGLDGYANDAPKALKWSRHGDRVQVSNPTPFNVTIAEVHAIGGGGQQVVDDQGKMVGPREHLEFKVPTQFNQMRFLTINDYGGRIEQTVSLSATP